MDKRAEKILAVCEQAFASSSGDCNKFVKVVAAPFFRPDPFPGLNADGIIEVSRALWTGLGRDHAAAIQAAKSGSLVIAGMTSQELEDAHGHLAIVAGVEGAHSGTVVVPLCYAGSLNARARVARRRVSETFGAHNAREGRISYFARVPNEEPTEEPFAILLDALARATRRDGQAIRYDGYDVWADRQPKRTNTRKRGAPRAAVLPTRSVER
jgi:hypothetical protein